MTPSLLKYEVSIAASKWSMTVHCQTELLHAALCSAQRDCTLALWNSFALFFNWLLCGNFQK